MGSDWFNRRKFLKAASGLLGGTAFLWADKRLGALGRDPKTCLCAEPNQANAASVFGPRVVHVHAPAATSWDFGNDYYGNYVDQGIVNEMVDQGLIVLTGAANIEDAWRSLIPAYSPGETAIAIKANFNNNLWCDPCSTGCADWQLKIDALIHPINAMIRGLMRAFPSFDPADVWVFDATIGSNPPVSSRHIPERFKDACIYPRVRFFDQGCNEIAGYNSSDSDAYVTWHNPADVSEPPAQKITDVLVQATYLINMPILKRHGGAGISLGFKNHFGSIDNCPQLHDWVCFIWPASQYSDRYNPLVDIFRNPHIEGKTILTVGDGLFGDLAGNANKPAPWNSFGRQAPNSLFFSTDPVAIDCVMCDILDVEGYQGGVQPQSDDYLRLAAGSGLGTYERGSPWQEPYGSGYQNIEYIRLPHPFTSFVDVPYDHWAKDYIEALYRDGYVAGCSLNPPMYCPERILSRAESSVFILRGQYGAVPDPPHSPPSTPTFEDVPSNFWGYGWIESLWRDGFTAGCSAEPLLYCPSREHTRAEACVFFLRIKRGVDYQPPSPVGLFEDVDLNAWYAGWVEAAYLEGLLPACGSNPLTFCPEAPLDRAWAAYMMCKAKDIAVP